jgi:Transposase zinc-ribbon domain
MAYDKDDLWRNFPKTVLEFERRFATEEACRAYWIEARWGGEPKCARCKRVWAERGGFLFECGDCDHQTRRNGISAKELQRILGLGSYKTAWSRLHKLRAALVRPDREPLGPFVQIDETPVGGKGSPHKELVLVAAEADGRVRLAHSDNNDEGTLKSFADSQIALNTPGRDRRARQLQRRKPPPTVAPGRHPDQTRAARERRPPGLPLDGTTSKALAAWHACRCGEAKAPASLPRRVRFPLQPAQNQRRRPHRGPHHRAAGRPPTARDENADPGNGALSSFPELTAQACL